jgi:hypothetical protein
VTYKMTVRRGGKPMYRTAVCSYCGDVMAEWHGHARHYRRTRRPPDPTTLARTIVDMAASGRQCKRRRGKARMHPRATRKTGAAGHRRRASS